MGNAAVYAVKIAVIIGLTLTFLIAINILIGYIDMFVIPGPLQEIIGLIGIYVPFDAGLVFGQIETVITAILAFMVANRIFELAKDNQRSA